ncbi:MAG TPA: aspartate kinase, partial [Aminobacteriaceae bacterium]|nr:aspartate kinase [Aminobacteriaceae bacterium]
EPSPRELDMLLATGEQMTSALLAMALSDFGIPALSYNAFQLEMTTTGDFSNARIMDLNLNKLKRQLEMRSVIVVTGFQGITPDGDLTTLGRGGSDTSAVAIAAKCGCPCEIYSDVAGVYTCDPNKRAGARKLEYITFDEMLELSSLGAKVLHSRAVEIAKKYSVDLYCASTFSDERGTYVVNSLPEWLEQPVVTGVTTDSNQMRVNIVRMPASMDAVSALFGGLAEQGVNVDMISTVNENGHSHLTFTVVDAKEKTVLETVRRTLAPWEGWNVTEDRNVAKISAVGVGMKSAPGVAARFFGALSRKGIKMLGTTTSEIKISALVSREEGDEALRALVDEFGLGEA